MIILRLPDSWSNWNLEMLVFEETRKPEYPEKNLSEQGREPTPNSTHIWRRRRDLTHGNIGGRWVLSSPLPHPCSQQRKRKQSKKLLISKEIKFAALKQFKIQMFRRVNAWIVSHLFLSYSRPVFRQVKFSFVPAGMKRFSKRVFLSGCMTHIIIFHFKHVI